MVRRHSRISKCSVLQFRPCSLCFWNPVLKHVQKHEKFKFSSNKSNFTQPEINTILLKLLQNYERSHNVITKCITWEFCLVGQNWFSWRPWTNFPHGTEGGYRRVPPEVFSFSPRSLPSISCSNVSDLWKKSPLAPRVTVTLIFFGRSRHVIFYFFGEKSPASVVKVDAILNPDYDYPFHHQEINIISH